MKTRLLILAIALLLGAGLQGCSKDDDYKANVTDLPSAVQADFQMRFPSVNKIKWEQRGNILKAEFYKDNVEHDAWYENNTTWAWIRTEKDFNTRENTLPQPIQTYLTNNYAGWRIDDVDFILVPSDEFYEIELEKKGEKDVILLIRADGSVIKIFIDNDGSDYNISASSVPQAVISAFQTKYPAAVRVKWEKEGELYEAEFLLKNERYDAYFKADGTWVYTEIELSTQIGTLPQAIQNHINTNYAGWRIDDVELVQTPTSEYYKIELEKGSAEVTLLIKADGTIVA